VAFLLVGSNLLGSLEGGECPPGLGVKRDCCSPTQGRAFAFCGRKNGGGKDASRGVMVFRNGPASVRKEKIVQLSTVVLKKKKATRGREGKEKRKKGRIVSSFRQGETWRRTSANAKKGKTRPKKERGKTTNGVAIKLKKKKKTAGLARGKRGKARKPPASATFAMVREKREGGRGKKEPANRVGGPKGKPFVSRWPHVRIVCGSNGEEKGRKEASKPPPAHKHGKKGSILHRERRDTTRCCT